MPSFTWSSRAFNQNTNGAKAAALEGPVIVTQRGEPTHVLLSYHRYRALTRKEPDIVTLLSMSDEEGEFFDFEPPRAETVAQPASFD